MSKPPPSRLEVWLRSTIFVVGAACFLFGQGASLITQFDREGLPEPDDAWTYVLGADTFWQRLDSSDYPDEWNRYWLWMAVAGSLSQILPDNPALVLILSQGGILLMLLILAFRLVQLRFHWAWSGLLFAGLALFKGPEHTFFWPSPSLWVIVLSWLVVISVWRRGWRWIDGLGLVAILFIHQLGILAAPFALLLALLGTPSQPSWWQRVTRHRVWIAGGVVVILGLAALYAVVLSPSFLNYFRWSDGGPSSLGAAVVQIDSVIGSLWVVLAAGVLASLSLLIYGPARERWLTALIWLLSLSLLLLPETVATRLMDFLVLGWIALIVLGAAGWLRRLTIPSWRGLVQTLAILTVVSSLWLNTIYAPTVIAGNRDDPVVPGQAWREALSTMFERANRLPEGSLTWRLAPDIPANPVPAVRTLRYSWLAAGVDAETSIPPRLHRPWDPIHAELVVVSPRLVAPAPLEFDGQLSLRLEVGETLVVQLPKLWPADKMRLRGGPFWGDVELRVGDRSVQLSETQASRETLADIEVEARSQARITLTNTGSRHARIPASILISVPPPLEWPWLTTHLVSTQEIDVAAWRGSSQPVRTSVAELTLMPDCAAEFELLDASDILPPSAGLDLYVPRR